MNIIHKPIKVKCVDATDYEGDEGAPLQSGKTYTAIESCVGVDTQGNEIEAIELREFVGVVFNVKRFVSKKTGNPLFLHLINLNMNN